MILLEALQLEQSSTRARPVVAGLARWVWRPERMIPRYEPASPADPAPEALLARLPANGPVVNKSQLQITVATVAATAAFLGPTSAALVALLREIEFRRRRLAGHS